MTDVPGGNPVRGWHPDPWMRGRLRWWDGRQWSSETAPAPGSGWSGPPIENTVGDAARWSLHASKAFLAQAAVAVLNAVLLLFVFADFADTFREALDDPNATPTFTPSPLSLVLNLVSFPAIVAVVVLAIWCYQGTGATRALGRPTAKSPGWAAAGWFVPVINFWFPYQAVRDLLPEGHPDRRRAGPWWACYLLGSVSVAIPAVVALFSLGAAMALTVVPVAFAVVACLLGRRIAAATHDHYAGA